MNDRTVVRWLIVLQVLLPIIGAIQNQFFLSGQPGALRAIVDPDVSTLGPTWLLGLVGLVVAVTWIFALIALFRFRPGAGKFYLVVSALYLIPMPFLPPSYSSWFSDWATTLGTLAAGMTIAWILLGRVPEGLPA